MSLKLYHIMKSIPIFNLYFNCFHQKHIWLAPVQTFREYVNFQIQLFSQSKLEDLRIDFFLFKLQKSQIVSQVGSNLQYV